MSGAGCTRDSASLVVSLVSGGATVLEEGFQVPLRVDTGAGRCDTGMNAKVWDAGRPEETAEVCGTNNVDGELALPGDATRQLRTVRRGLSAELGVEAQKGAKRGGYARIGARLETEVALAMRHRKKAGADVRILEAQGTLRANAGIALEIVDRQALATAGRRTLRRWRGRERGVLGVTETHVGRAEALQAKKDRREEGLACVGALRFAWRKTAGQLQDTRQAGGEVEEMEPIAINIGRASVLVGRSILAGHQPGTHTESGEVHLRNGRIEKLSNEGAHRGMGAAWVIGRKVAYRRVLGNGNAKVRERLLRVEEHVLALLDHEGVPTVLDHVANGARLLRLRPRTEGAYALVRCEGATNGGHPLGVRDGVVEMVGVAALELVAKLDDNTETLLNRSTTLLGARRTPRRKARGVRSRSRS